MEGFKSYGFEAFLRVLNVKRFKEVRGICLRIEPKL